MFISVFSMTNALIPLLPLRVLTLFKDWLSLAFYLKQTNTALSLSAPRSFPHAREIQALARLPLAALT